MPDWTPASLRPPRPEDGPFSFFDFNIIVAADANSHPPPRTTKSFDNAVRKYPSLQNELQQLCNSYSDEALAALADALRETIKGRVGRGRARLQAGHPPPANIRAEVQVRRLQGKSESEIARSIEPLLPPGQSKDALRKRAMRVVAQVPERTRETTGRLSYNLALTLWAVKRAERQLKAAVRRGVLSEEEAEQRLEGRKSRFLSRASKRRHP